MFKVIIILIMPIKTYNVSLEPEINKKWELIAKAEYRKKSELLRKWINENFKEEYDD